MFKNLFAKIGIGAASIDLVLDKDAACMGETIHGQIKLRGGSVAQEINGIQVDLHLVSQYRKEDELKMIDIVVGSVKLEQIFTIQPEQETVFDFQFTIPLTLPVTAVNTKFYFKTNLDVENALDRTDKDYIHIYPSGYYRAFLEGLVQLGCRIQSDYYDGRTQVLKLATTHWMAGKLDELEFKVDISAITQNIRGTCEIDKKTSGVFGALTDALDLDEYEGHFYFGVPELQSAGHAAYAIQQFVEEKYKRLWG